MKCCVYTRSFAERPYMDFFIEHYIHLGFDKIIILKSDKMEYKYPIEYEKYQVSYLLLEQFYPTIKLNYHYCDISCF